MKDHLIRPAIAVLLGGFIAVCVPREVRIFILAFFLLLLFRLWFLWKPRDFFGRMVRPEVLLLAVGVVSGFLYGMTGDKLIAPSLTIGKIQLEGKISDWKQDKTVARGEIVIERVLGSPEAQIVEEGTGSIEKIEIGDGTESFGNRKYSLRVYPDSQENYPEGWDQVKPGDQIRINGKLEHPKPPGTAGEFDLALYNAVRGLRGSITAKGEAFLLVQGIPGISWRIRNHVQQVLDSHWPDQAGVLEGILFGDSSRISSETLDMYKTTGVMHVFAASGSNVAFVMALAWGAFFFLPKRFRILGTMAAILLYAGLCQGNPPILRATILGAAVLLGMFGKGRVPPLRFLFIAALILFFINPLYLKDTSFQLSFAAAWGMVVLTPRLEKIPWMGKLPQPFRTAAAVTFSAQLATFPILVDIFHRISLVGIFTNIFILFLLGAVLQLGVIGMIVLPIPVLHLVFFQAAFWLLQITDTVLGLFASLPLAYFWVLNPGMVFWIFWYVALGVWLIGRKKVWYITRIQARKIRRTINKGLAGLNKNFGMRLPLIGEESGKSNQESVSSEKSLAVLMKEKGLILLIPVLLFLLLISPSFQKNRLQITFLDVGQGDCILIESPSEKLLVDTGPRSSSFDAGERVVVPYLMEQRIGSLDMVLITHEDIDHIGGAKYVLYNIPTKELIVPEVGDRLFDSGWVEGIPTGFLDNPEKLMKIKAGDTLQFPSGLRIEVLAPVDVIGNSSADSNNNSLVLLLHYFDKKILLTGDMEEEEMQQIVDRGADWDADFIKIPHHGSAGSLNPSWFDRTSPLAVFIPVGRNSFGHPTAGVLSYWEERGIPVYRTDTQGTIRLIIDQEGYRIIPGRI